MACTPSARLEENFSDSTSEAAEEGTVAHALGELLIRQKLKLLTKAQSNKLFKEIEADKYYSASMREYADEYATFVVEKFNSTKKHTPDAEIFIEQKIDLTRFIPEGFGTGDCFIVADRILDFTDYKHGKGVRVDAVDNKQMMIYALGAYIEFSILYEIETVRMTIYQPRIDNISTFEISVKELLEWAEKELKPKARLAFDGEGKYVPGDHCRFCKAKALCKANANKQMKPVTDNHYKNPDLMNKLDVAYIIKEGDTIVKWINSVKEFALAEALNGENFEGLKLVEGRSNRIYRDPDEVAKTLIAAGYEEAIIYEKNLLGLTKMGEALGKKKMEELLGDLIVKPAGKPSLVDVADKRPEWSSAVSDFDGLFD
jgi:hypothetical protein